jgi:hypothetical protein
VYALPCVWTWICVIFTKSTAAILDFSMVNKFSMAMAMAMAMAIHLNPYIVHVSCIVLVITYMFPCGHRWNVEGEHNAPSLCQGHKLTQKKKHQHCHKTRHRFCEQEENSTAAVNVDDSI